MYGADRFEKTWQLGFDLYKIADFFQLGAMKTRARALLSVNIKAMVLEWNASYETWFKLDRPYEEDYRSEVFPVSEKLMEHAKAVYDLPVGEFGPLRKVFMKFFVQTQWLPLMDPRMHDLIRGVPQMGADILSKLMVCPFDNAEYEKMVRYWQGHPIKPLPTRT